LIFAATLDFRRHSFFSGSFASQLRHTLLLLSRRRHYFAFDFQAISPTRCHFSPPLRRQIRCAGNISVFTSFATVIACQPLRRFSHAIRCFHCRYDALSLSWLFIHYRIDDTPLAFIAYCQDGFRCIFFAIFFISCSLHAASRR